MPAVVNNRSLGFTVPKTVEVPQLPLFAGRRILCRLRRLIPMVFLLGRPWRLRSCSIFPGGRCPCWQLVQVLRYRWRRYRFLWSLTTEILQLQCLDKVIDVFVQVQHVVRSRGRQPSSPMQRRELDGWCRALCTGTRPGLTPAIRAGKGWRGRRELAPRCSATQVAARRHDPGQTRRVLNSLKHNHHNHHQGFCSG